MCACRRIFQTIIATGAAFALASCSQGDSGSATSGTSGQPYATLKISKNLGKLVSRSYSGKVAGDKFCILTLFSYALSGDGIYNIQLLCSNGRFISGSGDRYTLRGKDDATIWECRPCDGSQSNYFMYDSSTDTLFWLEDDSSDSRRYPLIPMGYLRVDSAH